MNNQLQTKNIQSKKRIFTKRVIAALLFVGVVSGITGCKKIGDVYTLGNNSRGIPSGSLMSELTYQAHEGFLDRRFIRVTDEDGVLQYVEVDNDLIRDPLDYSNLSKNEQGYLTYDGPEVLDTKIGIDVSSYQGNINWDKVKASGIDYAILRIGFRGYGSQGKLVADETFATNYENAKKAGVPTGIYFYSQAVNYDEGVEEAKMVLRILRENNIHNLAYPIVFDTESAESTDARTYRLSKEDFTQAALGFCETIEAAGYTPMIYSNKSWYALKLDMTTLSKYDWWYAQYNNEMNFPYRVRMWQYSAKGNVPGIGTDVDMDIEFIYDE